MTHVTIPALTVGSVTIREHGGLYSLNDLHKASGGEENYKPAFFLRNSQTKALIAEMAKGTDSYLFLKSTKGRFGSTYACRELVIAYAAWISAAFQLKVIRVFLDTVAPEQSAQIPLLAADTQRELQALVDQLASANHQAIEQAQTLSARMAHTTERSKQAHVLALAAAHSVANQVFTVAMDEDADIGLDRWILAVGYGDKGKPVNTIVKPIDRDAYVLSDTGFIDALAAGDVGVTLTNQELSRLAQVALQRIARRVSRQQPGAQA